jgi:hypothetical protein
VDDATAESRLKAAVNEKVQRLTPHLNDELSKTSIATLAQAGAQLVSIDQVRVLPNQRRAFVNVRLAIEVTLDP